MKDAASAVIVDLGGTISHQHGVGRDHRRYLPAEKGALGIRAIETVAGVFDPDGIMAPGTVEGPAERSMSREAAPHRDLVEGPARGTEGPRDA